MNHPDPQPGAGSATSNIPEAIQNAIAEFSRTANLDESRLLAGDAFEVKGLNFRLQHHGHADPTGVVVQVVVGSFGDQLIAGALADLLSLNVTRPAALAGYFGFLHESATAVLCIRAEVSDAVLGAQTIARIVAGASEGVHDILKVVRDDLLDTGAAPPARDATPA